MSRGPESVADRIAGAVAATGARYAFGHPGGEVVVLIDALQRAGVEFVLTHHETEAAFMASGAGEITGTPGVAISTLGPGATNMVTGAASALLERAPVLLFTGALARAAPAGTTHQALDLNALYAPVTKRTYALTPESADADMADAVALAGRTPAGPVHLSLASDIATMPAEDRDGHGPDAVAGDPSPSIVGVPSARPLAARRRRAPGDRHRSRRAARGRRSRNSTLRARDGRRRGDVAEGEGDRLRV